MRVEQILPAGSWDTTREVDQVLIDYDRRFRRRIVLTTVPGPRCCSICRRRCGCATATGCWSTTGVVRVRAQAEDLMEIHAHRDGELVRIAWHLGNRHLPVQLLGDRIRIRADHVIGEMVEGLGGHVDLIEAPFDPEAAPMPAAAIITMTTMMTITTDHAGRCCTCLVVAVAGVSDRRVRLSHGLEWAVEAGDISDGDTLRSTG